MIISHKLMILYGPYLELNNKSRALLIIIWLRYLNKITDAKMKGMFRALRSGSYDTAIGAWNSGIKHPHSGTDIWYTKDDGNLTKSMALARIFVEDLHITTSLPYKDLISGLKLYHNANTNYCIDWLWKKIVEPLLDSDIDNIELFDMPIKVMSYDKANRIYDLAQGYCCSDCDGCLGEYKRRKYENRYKIKDSEVITKAMQYLNSLKTHQKNPKNILNYDNL